VLITRSAIFFAACFVMHQLLVMYLYVRKNHFDCSTAERADLLFSVRRFFWFYCSLFDIHPANPDTLALLRRRHTRSGNETLKIKRVSSIPFQRQTARRLHAVVAGQPPLCAWDVVENGCTAKGWPISHSAQQRMYPCFNNG
jgi:hypothetical protein